MQPRRTFLVTLAVAAAACSLGLIVPTASHAQGAPGQGQGRFMRGGMGPGAMGVDPTTNNEATLIRRMDVRRELMMSGYQQNQVDTLLKQQQQEMADKYRESITQMRQKMQAGGQDPRTMDPEERRTMMQDMGQQMQKQIAPVRDAQTKALEAILTPGQVARLHQLDLQLRGPLALSDPIVATPYNLSDDQTTKVTSILQEYRTSQGESMRSVFAGGGRRAAGRGPGAQAGGAQPGAAQAGGTQPDPNSTQSDPAVGGRPAFDPEAMQARMKEAQKKMDVARKEKGVLVLAVLSPEQKQLWLKQQGRPFTFEPGDSAPPPADQ